MAKELNEDTGFQVSIKSLIAIGFAMATIIGMWFDLQAKHKIAVIPTIIIFKDGVEVARFQADLSFKMLATRKEVQNEINNQLMSDF